MVYYGCNNAKQTNRLKETKTGDAYGYKIY